MKTSLCENCKHRREVVSGKGSRFLLCLLSQTDKGYTKYPPQPVLRCDGYEPRQDRTLIYNDDANAQGRRFGSARRGDACMGLNIYYSMTTSLTAPEQVAKLVQSMRAFALDLPFQEVSEVMQLGGTAGAQRADDPNLRWLRIQATESVAGQFVEPLHAIGFWTLPGQGCESANFAFCTYPVSVEPKPGSGRKRRIPTKLAGWRWSTFCKTQYASDPKCGGIENFLRCHLSVVKMLDFANQTRLVTVEARDDGGYWESRDLERLVKEVGDWNEMVAGVVSLLRPLLEGQGTVQAPITGFSSFEHLEAKGLAKLSALWKSLEE